MSREDVTQYLCQTLSFGEVHDMGAIDCLVSEQVSPEYCLYVNTGAHGIYLELLFNDEDRTPAATVMLSPEKATEQGMLDFFRHHGYPPAVRLHRLAILQLLAE